MSELAATAERLRVVKDACIDFFTLWAMDRLMAEHRLCDRIHMDMARVSENAEKDGPCFLHSSRRLDD